MDTDQLNRIIAEAEQQHATLDAQLRELESHQQALLASLRLTNETMDTIPALTTIAPVFNEVPAYLNKLTNLKTAMTKQATTLGQLQKRADTAKDTRKSNQAKMQEKWEKEREMDRTELKAQWRAETTTEEIRPTRSQSDEEIVSVESGVDAIVHPDSFMSTGTFKAEFEVESPGPSRVATPILSGQPGTPRVVAKRKKKARQVEMD